MSEIEDIFATKKPKVIAPVASSSTPPEKKKKKRKREPESVDDADLIRPKTRPAPQTIIDPSSHIPSHKQATHKDRIPEDMIRKLPLANQSSEAHQKFKDSRGSGPRRKTTEGWSIYREDELGIRDEGGDTPLCPFDCDCCF